MLDCSYSSALSFSAMLHLSHWHYQCQTNNGNSVVAHAMDLHLLSANPLYFNEIILMFRVEKMNPTPIYHLKYPGLSAFLTQLFTNTVGISKILLELETAFSTWIWNTRPQYTVKHWHIHESCQMTYRSNFRSVICLLTTTKAYSFVQANRVWNVTKCAHMW